MPATDRRTPIFALKVLAGCGVVWVMAELLVAVGADVAKRVGISEGVIGLWTGVGTSFPELAVSLLAVFRGAGLLSVGNLIGSNITDPFASLGIGAVVATGLDVSTFLAQTASGVWLGATIFVVAIFWMAGAVTRQHGIVLMLVYMVSQYLFITY